MTERIKQKRIERNLSINELARRSGVDKKTIRLLESGERKPKRATLESIAKAMGITLVELTGKDPADYEQRKKICDGCYYWKRITGCGDGYYCCHYAHEGEGTVTVGNKLDMINGACHAKRTKKRNSGPAKGVE